MIGPIGEFDEAAMCGRVRRHQAVEMNEISRGGGLAWFSDKESGGNVKVFDEIFN